MTDKVISEILEDVQEEQNLSQQQVESPEEEEQVQDEQAQMEQAQDEQAQEEEQGEPTITEEQAKEWGLHHSFVGKPISELGKAYRNLASDYTRKSQKLKELEKPSEETQDILDDMPDPVEDLEAFKKWVKAELSKKNRDPELEAYIQREKEEKILNAIQSELPKGVKAEDIIKEWGAQGYVQSESDVQYFVNRPEVFVNSVLTYYKATLADKKSGDKKVQKATKALSTNQPNIMDINSESRTGGKGDDLLGEILEDLTIEQQFRG